ncbi:30S ribosomal protein S1 [Risungbinella massiliensis]|uniref:30S ribosomal protein S1 n=1 Tax=Risungbinella massiliensis TaxID=1329796 RepID=UPI0005CC3B9F|nr:30S ribosomal protein S1 [Risungbinella massiliensis]
MTEELKTELEQVSSFQVGDLVKGKVVKVEANQALLDVGYKSEAVLPISEVSVLHLDQVADVVAEGDELSVKVIRLGEEDQLIVSKKAVDSEKAWEVLPAKFESGEVITAKVADVVKGGLVVDLGVRGFIPASLVENFFVEDFSDYKGKELTLKIVELDQEKKKCILSHRAVLEEEAARQKEQVLSNLQVGEVREGTVQRLTDFGAFVDIGGVDGLVHVSEIAWSHVGHPSEVLSEGDKVQVKVLKVDLANGKISLSMKETQEGPWDKAAKEIHAGAVVKGTVKRLASFGAFVELLPGVEGLVHISQISQHRIETPQEVLKEGQEVEAKVLDVKADQQRISLSMKELEPKVEKPKKVEKKQEEVDPMTNTGLGVTLGDVYPELRKLKND